MPLSGVGRTQNKPEKVLVVVPLWKDLADKILPLASPEDRGVLLAWFVHFGYEYVKSNGREIAALLAANGVKAN